MTILTEEDREILKKDHEETIEFIKSLKILKYANVSPEDLMDCITISIRKIEKESASIERAMMAIRETYKGKDK